MNKMKILLVEDELQLATNIKKILEYENFEVQHAPDGKMACEYALHQKPDLVICDVMMPEMNGYEFHERFIKLGYKDVPFIFLTAKANYEDARTGMSLGADDYLTKPLKRTDLLNAIKARMSRKKIIQEDLQIAIEKSNIILQKKDAYLREIAYNQSHIIRAPLATLMAVIDLLEPSTMDDDNKTLVKLLKPLTKELDKVITENVYMINNV